MRFLTLPFQLALSAVLETILTIENFLSGRYLSEDGSSFWNKLWYSIAKMPAMIGENPATTKTSSSSFSFSQTASQIPSTSLAAVYTQATVTAIPSAHHQAPIQYYTQNVHVQPAPPLPGQDFRAIVWTLVPCAILIWIFWKTYNVERPSSPRTAPKAHQSTQTDTTDDEKGQGESPRSLAQQSPKPRPLSSPPPPSNTPALPSYLDAEDIDETTPPEYPYPERRRYNHTEFATLRDNFQYMKYRLTELERKLEKQITICDGVAEVVRNRREVEIGSPWTGLRPVEEKKVKKVETTTERRCRIRAAKKAARSLMSRPNIASPLPDTVEEEEPSGCGSTLETEAEDE